MSVCLWCVAMGLIIEYLSLQVNMKWERVFLLPGYGTINEYLSLIVKCLPEMSECMFMVRSYGTMFSFVSGISSICVSEVFTSNERVYVYGA